MTLQDTPPDPNTLHPIPGQNRVVLLKTLIKNPLIKVGDFSYYDDPDDATAFESKNVLRHYGPERLIIGKFCAIAAGAQFIMNGANHRMSGPSTYPFPIMGGSWAEHMDLVTELPNRGDTVVGNDVWIGGNVTIMPGIRIGNGAIISTGSIVTKDVPDYGVVGGKPATLIRYRFTAPQIQILLDAAWWDWPLEMISKHVRTISDGSIEELAAIAELA